ncbi:MAG: tRNA (adenosine(37)-N6)-threonylcarbamoyltransferase complex transferase subunit TsaD [Aestuariivita sp.]|nr:tRNA (adenosine(37)-N6)-threonylcarbamoyltransferase complex transferase subunit TsaD [Aestuariivita sp.]
MTSVIVLGLESSCDDTAAAVVRVGADHSAEICSSVIVDQQVLHQSFGGVVPEIAARAHTEKLDICTELALQQANIGLSDVKVIAVTAGPGLIGGLFAGIMFAKGLSAARDIPLIGVNHLAGHALTPKMSEKISFPYLILLISGGHSQFLVVHESGKFQRLGGTIDDAPGEAFDKTARLLGLSQPGGPSIERAARSGDGSRFNLPRPLLNQPNCNMSFSGLKTAVLRTRDQLIEKNQGISQSDRSDIAASFQAAVSDVLTEKSRTALSMFLSHASPQDVVFAVAGGVAANQTIRCSLLKMADDFNARFVAPPIELCTDNAAMIAYAGGLSFLSGHVDDLNLSARSRWPLDISQPSLLGFGRKGAKA